MQNLLVHKYNAQSNSSVKVGYEFHNQYLFVTFNVEVLKVHTSSEFCHNSYQNWGLWETDVVEVFLTRSLKKTPYLELQMSPLQQKFALIIDSPREHYRYPSELNTRFESFVSEDKTLWTSTFKVSYVDIPGDENIIYGNFHAILGKRDNRSFFGSNLNPEEQVDFHRPDLFLKLGEIPC